MKTKEEILNDLNQFTGSELYYIYSPLFPNVRLTEGAHYLANECNAYWLMDMIASYLPVKDSFAIATLAVAADRTAAFTLCDDLPPKVVHASQDVPYTNFPLDEIKLYVQYDGERWIILLPSEY